MNYNKYIDHTLLRADATQEEIIQLCEEAKQYDFMSVCVNPDFVSLCKNNLKGSDVNVCTVVGFPLGSTTTNVKIFEAKQALKNGADEIDMVVNIS
jgi:deoxyribose-phosphate aldolase